MLKSMTGFGQAQTNLGNATLQAEVKSLNSKFLDLTLRLPRLFTDKEFEIRNLVAEKLERGKISITIDLQASQGAGSYNEEEFTRKYAELKRLADKVMAPYDKLFELALQSASETREEKADAELSKQMLTVLSQAMEACDAFRVHEGNALIGMLTSYVESIRHQLGEVGKLDGARVEKIRSRIKKGLSDFFGDEGFDANRMEQEIIYYIEKLDIHEERVRLGTHLDHFMAVVSEKQSNGKKLGFICQEMGREINTIGSKANDAAIQKAVVVMKEELEKIKEQLNNVL